MSANAPARWAATVDRPRALSSPAPSGPAQDGSAVAEEPWLAAPADRRTGGSLLAHGATLPRRVPPRRPEARAPLQVARPQGGAAFARTLRRGVLLGPPAAQRQRGRQGHPRADG